LKNTDQLNNIFQKYLNQSCSPEEMQQLLDYFGTTQTDAESLEQLVEKVLLSQDVEVADIETQSRLDAGFQQILAKRVLKAKPAMRLKMLYSKWAVAATLFVAVGAGLFYFTKSDIPANVVANQITLKPGTEKARLTLADGTVIDLEQAVNGKLNSKDGVAVIKTDDGKLVYDVKNMGNANGPVSYNTLVTPRGGQYDVILPDGSVIWLNAASSLRFPTRFVGAERRVELSGEGYFEIKKNAKQPFVVVSGGQEVTVLGTHFNINAYQENNIIKTTLLEGAVKVSKGAQSCLLAPGQESSLDNLDNSFSIAKNVDVNVAVAWKNGRFSFDATNIKEVMQQIARWYDVEVLYKGDFSNVELTGEIPRGADANRVLNLLKGTKQVDFIINGRSITVIPYK
jgi:transmembrane sensor